MPLPGEQTPYQTIVSYPIPATALGADYVGEIRAPFDGTVASVTYAPVAAITGAATNNRTVSVVNKGQTGVGTTVVASLNYAAAVNAVAFDENTITLSAVANATTVASGDVLALLSTHIGTGIADPGGTLFVTFARL